MRRLVLFLVLTAGCTSADPRLVAILKDEIRSLGGMAKIPGPRSTEQVARIDSDVAAALAHVDSVTR